MNIRWGVLIGVILGAVVCLPMIFFQTPKYKMFGSEAASPTESVWQEKLDALKKEFQEFKTADKEEVDSLRAQVKDLRIKSREQEEKMDLAASHILKLQEAVQNLLGRVESPDKRTKNLQTDLWADMLTTALRRTAKILSDEDLAPLRPTADLQKGEKRKFLGPDAVPSYLPMDKVE